MRILAIIVFAAVLISPAMGQKPVAIAPAQVVQAVRDYRMDNEDRIVRELTEFLSIPNVASDTPNIQKNAAHLVEMLEARGIETHLLTIEGRGPVVFGKLISPMATHTVIFYAHYDGQPVDPAAWTDGTPFTPVLRTDSIEAGKTHSVSGEQRESAGGLPRQLADICAIGFRRQIADRGVAGRAGRAARERDSAEREFEGDI